MEEENGHWPNTEQNSHGNKLSYRVLGIFCFQMHWEQRLSYGKRISTSSLESGLTKKCGNN